MIRLYDSAIGAVICDGFGVSIVKRLLDVGCNVKVCSLSEETGDLVAGFGISVSQSLRAAFDGCQAILTALVYPEDVEEAYLSTDGLVASARAGSFAIDLTTTSPRLARELHAIGSVNDLHILDCPVVGGAQRALEGQLTCFVGGEKSDLQQVEPLLGMLADTISYQGIAGSGQVACLAAKVALAGALTGVMEALSLAKVNALDPAVLFDAIRASGMLDAPMDRYIPAALAEEFHEGYPVDYLAKDLSLALDAGDEQDLTLPAAETAYQLSDLLSVVGGASMGLQGLSLVYEEEDSCAKYGLDWSRADDLEYPDFDDFGPDDDEDFDEYIPHRHFRTPGPGDAMGSFFSAN